MSESGFRTENQRSKTSLRLWLTPGLGLAACHRLLAEAGGPREVFSLTRRDLERLSIQPPAVEDLFSSSSEERAEREWERATSSGVRIIDIEDPHYPPLLKEIFDPPIVLYVRQTDWDARMPHLAVVGTRRPSPYGLYAAERLGLELAGRGIAVVSGLARGIDTAAHRGALSAGRTVAVLGTGIDRVYPAENRQLAELIGRKGALLSEFPLGTPPLPRNFPLRNRLLAGLTLGTVVVEARQRSGSLITARLALEANREVFAVPGPIDSPRSTGPHALIRQGACLVTRPEDIVEELPASVQRELTTPAPEEAAAIQQLTAPQRSVLEALSASEARGMDSLLTNLDLPPSEIYSALLQLELEGLVRQHTGDRYLLSPPGDTTP